MNIIQIELLAIAVAAAVACTLPGVFLVLRGVALMSDAISHAILLGIVTMFLLTQQLYTPFLLLGAACAGLATVMGTQALIHSQLIKKDAAIGLVYPLFFSIGVILITLFAHNVHIDADMVLLGELAFAPFNRIIFNDTDYGPIALWQLLTIIGINSAFIFLFYKELSLSIFDADYATISGFRPTLLYYGLMAITSITAVGAFDAVGSIVVVALMIVPPASAFLLTQSLRDMIITSIFLSILSALGGYLMATIFDVTIAGSIATVAGLIFAIIFGATQSHRIAQI